MRILFADDAKDTRDLFTLVFAIEGFHTQTACNGAEALVAVLKSKEPFDVIVLDIEMPEMDGWQALKAIRSLPKAQHMPIIMFTGYGNEVRARALQEGAQRIVHKPMLPKEMVRVLHEVKEQRTPASSSLAYTG